MWKLGHWVIVTTVISLSMLDAIYTFLTTPTFLFTLLSSVNSRMKDSGSGTGDVLIFGLRGC
jgi:hypothetical protein